MGIKKYEHDLIGYNSRLDTIQTLILIRKLSDLNSNNNKKKIAQVYNKNINNKIIKLKYSSGCVYHQYVVLSKFEKKL